MASFTTEKAVRQLLVNEEYLLLWLRSGYTKAYRRQCLHLLKRGELSAKVQEKILVGCGCRIAVERIWEIIV